MATFTQLVRDLFCLAHVHHASGEAGDGRGFELRVERHLAAIGVRPVDVFSGVRSLGSQSLSGLYHQIDATGATREAVVIGEWKAYRGAIPKNDLLRFKAVTDDYWLRQHRFATAPVMRVFGGTGYVSPALRRYAAQWGICLITTDRWPSPLLASTTTTWPDSAPDRLERRYLAWLTRPLDAVCAPQEDGSWRIPRPLLDATVDHFLRLHDRWSDQLGRRFAPRAGSFDRWISETIPWGAAA
jgi:hypothetical protein